MRTCIVVCVLLALPLLLLGFRIMRHPGSGMNVTGGKKNEGFTHDFRGSSEDRDDDVGAGAVGMEGNRGVEGPG